MINLFFILPHPEFGVRQFLFACQLFAVPSFRIPIWYTYNKKAAD